MTMSAPACSCERDIFPSFGPCPVHGSKWNKDEIERSRRRAEAAEARVARLEAAVEVFAEAFDTLSKADHPAIAAMAREGAESARHALKGERHD